MYQRHFSLSMGSLRRSWAHDIPALSNCSARSFHVSARRCEDSSSNSASTPDAQPARETRRTRSNLAFRKVTNLANGIPPTDSPTPTRTGPLIRKEFVDGNPRAPGQSGNAPPGTMVRAPAKLRITRNAPDSNLQGPNLRGPNLRGRGRPAPGAKENRAPGRASEATPKRRERKPATESSAPTQAAQDDTVEDTLSDGMVQQLLRLQRKEWDKVPYEPKYAHGSKAAMELIKVGKTLFQGERPEIKVPGRLEKRIGIVGMHGA